MSFFALKLKLSRFLLAIYLYMDINFIDNEKLSGKANLHIFQFENSLKL